jgi:hypothetical protein
MSGGKCNQFSFQAAMAASSSSFRIPRPPRVPPAGAARHEWVRPNQTLLFDKAKESEKISTYHIPVRLPPVGNGFRGFIYHEVDGNLGMGEDVIGPSFLVGFVIEVMVHPFTCKNERVHANTEGDTFKLDTPIAKPIYGLLEDAKGHVHAISLSLIKPSTLIKGIGLTDHAFNWSGFPPKVGRTDSLAKNQGLVMGIQVHNQDLCPAGTAPVFRIGWESAKSLTLRDVRFFDLVSTPELSAAPGYWLTYKLMNYAALTTLKEDRLETPEVDQLYEGAGANKPEHRPTSLKGGSSSRAAASGEIRVVNASPNPYDGLDDFIGEPLPFASDQDGETADVNAEDAEGGRAEDTLNDQEGGDSSSSPASKLPRLDPCGAMRWQSLLGNTAPRSEEDQYGGVGTPKEREDTTPQSVVQVLPDVGDVEIPGTRLEGIVEGQDLTSASGGSSIREDSPVLVDQTTDETSESEDGESPDRTKDDLGVEKNEDAQVDSSDLPRCLFHYYLEKAGIIIDQEMLRKDCGPCDPGMSKFCSAHVKIARSLVGLLQGGLTDRQETHPPNSGEAERRWCDPENALVEGSKYWTPQRGRGKGQSFPPLSVWSSELGLRPEPPSPHGTPKILKSERRIQLELTNREYRLAYYLRQYFPRRAQPYPIYWDMDQPLPSPDSVMTMAEDLVTNFDLVGGMGQLVGNHMVVLMKVEPRWTPGLDVLGRPHLPQPFRVMIGRVAKYDAELETLGVHASDISSELEEADYIHFDREHLSRAVDDLTEYWKWCVHWVQSKLLDQVDYTDVRTGYQYILLGRLPITLAERYAKWRYKLDFDQGLDTLLLKALNPEEYERRRTVGIEIYNQEAADMRSYGIQACTSHLSDSDLELLVRCHPRARSREYSVEHSRTAVGVSTSSVRDTPLSAKVRKADPRVVSRESYYLSNQLFGPDNTQEAKLHVQWEDGLQSFSTPQKYDDNPGEGLSRGAQEARPNVVWRTPSQKGNNQIATEILGQRGVVSNIPARPQVSRTPIPVSALTPEIKRLAALRSTEAYPRLGKFGAKNVLGKSPGKEQGSEEFDEPSFAPVDRPLPDVDADELPVKSATSFRRSAPRGHTTPIGDLGSDFRREPSGGDPGLRATYRDPGSRPSRRAGLDDFTDTRDLMDSMRRMAVATESSARVKTQGDIYKDLNLLPLQYEMLSNPTLGAVLTMIPTVYHIYGVRGHLPPLTPQMNGPARYRSTMDYLYYDAPWVDPALLLELRIRLTPRILIVLSFGLFKGTMAFHPSDVVMVSEESHLDMATPGFHLSGKSLPASGLPKLTPPEPHKLTTNFTAFWELLDHFVLLFSLIYGEGHRIPLTLLIQDLKALQRKDHGLTTREIADLFTRILGYHQDQIITAFTERGGLLSHIQTQEELLAEASREDIDTELMPRLVPWPRFTPGSPAYNTFYLGPREFLYQYQRDLSVRKLREEAEAARSKKPVKRFGQGQQPEIQDLTSEEIIEDVDVGGAFGGNIRPREIPAKKEPPSDPKPEKPKKKQPGPRPKPFVLTTEQLAKGTYALFELQQHLLTTKSIKEGQEICLRFLSHIGCNKCDRVHLPKEALSGVTISPWLKILMITHKGYRGDKVLNDTSAQLSALARLVKQGSA